VAAGNTSVWVTDITGRKVIEAEQEVNLSAGKYERFINVSSLNTGAYFLILKTNDGLATQKFIIERWQ